MTYKTQQIRIEEVTDTDIAYALAYLADFPQGSFVGRVRNIYRCGNSRKCLVVFHKETLDGVGGNVMEAVAYRGPDIIVGQVKRPPEGMEAEWYPTGKYCVEFSDRVDESLVAKIEEEIKLAYLER